MADHGTPCAACFSYDLFGRPLFYGEAVEDVGTDVGSETAGVWQAFAAFDGVEVGCLGIVDAAFGAVALELAANDGFVFAKDAGNLGLV